MTDNIVVPQSPTSPGVIVTDNDKGHHGHRGLEGKDATFIQQTQLATANQMLNRDIADLRASLERNFMNTTLASRDATIELLKTDSRRGEQLSAIMARFDSMEANSNAKALQEAKDEVQLLKIKFGVVP